MGSAAPVIRVRTLYKRILVLHRFLPIELRVLGDQYVKDEFKRHKSAHVDQAQLFLDEWEQYKESLQSQVLDAVGTRMPAFGTDLSEHKLRDFQDHQIGQLYQLMLESTKPSRQFQVQEEVEEK